MFVDPHVSMDHPCDHVNDVVGDAVIPAVPVEEPVRVAASTSESSDIQERSLPQDTPAFQVPSHSQHEDHLPQLTERQKEELMLMHTELTAQENPVKQFTSFEFEEPRNQTDVYNAIFKEPQDKADVSNAISGEPQGESDDNKSISEEESDQEEWTPKGKGKQGRRMEKSNVNSIELQEESDQKEWTRKGKRKQRRRIEKSNVELQEESDEEEWTPKGKRKQGRPKSNVKRKYTKQNSAKTQDSEGS